MSRLLKLSSLWARDPSGRAWKTPAWALPGPPLSVTMQRPSTARSSATRVRCRADLAPRVRAAGPRAVQPRSPWVSRFLTPTVGDVLLKGRQLRSWTQVPSALCRYVAFTVTGVAARMRFIARPDWRIKKKKWDGSQLLPQCHGSRKKGGFALPPAGALCALAQARSSLC